MDNFAPGIFINCRAFPFLTWILSGLKVYETRNRNTLRSLVGKRVLLIETGHGRPVVRGSARIKWCRVVRTRCEWNMLRKKHRVPVCSTYDWKNDTKVKYCYLLDDVKPCNPFPVSDGVRHGRVWMEVQQ